ncbi:MAG: hypothetical protein WCF31_09260, partial [Candidatus Deferrimicrobiaceae bacterium]
MGDEVRRSQGGNNNAYCQDNETSWFDWDLLERHADVRRFVRLLIAGRLQPDIALTDPAMTLNQLLGQARLEWHGVRLGDPDWREDSHSLALTAWTLSRRVVFHLLINAWRDPLSFELPPTRDTPGGFWRRWLDTSLPSPAEIVPLDEAPEVGNGTYKVPSHSVAVFFARGVHIREASRTGTPAGRLKRWFGMHHLLEASGK